MATRPRDLLPVLRSAGPVPRLLARATRRFAALQASTSRLAEELKQLDVAPRCVLLPGLDRPMPPGAPDALVVHEPAPPEARARLLSRLARHTAWPGGVVALTPAEWTVAALDPVLSRFDAEAPAWGEPPAPPPEPDPVERRRRELRGVAGAHRAAFAALAERRDPSLWLRWSRDELEALGSPSRFPPRPGDEDPGSAGELAAAVGAFHAVFAGEVAVDDGAGLPSHVTSTPLRSTAAIEALLRPLLADLPRHFGPTVRALYLLPGPWGTRLCWRLVAIVPDEAPLHGAVRLRDRLQQHLGMLPRKVVRAAMLSVPGPVVLTEASALGLVRRRLSARPLERLGVSLHRRLLLGEDVLAEALRGPHLATGDLAAELGGLLRATAACWRRDARDAAVRELLLGSWPALIHLARGGDVTEPLSAVHAALTGSADPAVAHVAARATREPLDDPGAVDLGRPTVLLRDEGPALVRLQEVAFEAFARSS
jgi:hypothetical protein